MASITPGKFRSTSMFQNSNDEETKRGKCRITGTITSCVQIKTVLTAIELEDYTALETRKINNEPIDRNSSPEMKALRP